MASNYPPGISAADPHAPWNETDPGDAQPVIDDLDGKDLFQSGNYDLDGTLDVFGGRVEFEVPNHYAVKWDDLTAEERALFEQYAEVVRGFASLYERGLAEER